MIELQRNRYLWIHFAGLAFVPLLLDGCLAGLASAGPALPFGAQFWAIALFGIAPALAMQWLKPFYVFSLPPSALKPAALSEDQRRCLQIFKSWQIKALAVLVAVLSLWLLKQVYVMLPQVSPLLPPRAGLALGAIAFFTTSTFMQISVSAGRALLIGPGALKRVPAVEESAITSDFLILGIRLNSLLSDIPTQPMTKESADLDESTPAIRTSPVEAEPTLIPSVEARPPVEAEEKTTLQAAVELAEVEPTEAESTEVIESSKVTEPPKAIELPKDAEETEIVIPEKLPPEEDLST